MNVADILQKVEATIDSEWRREISRNEQKLRDRGIIDQPEIDAMLEVCRADWREAKKHQLAETAAWLRGRSN
jgi:hypothetical protein